MHAIDAPEALPAGTTLYHAAFGFAVVDAVTPHEVVLSWEQPGPHLPRRVRHATVRRIYRSCKAGGFFDRVLREPDTLKRALLEQPVSAVLDLLEDLAVPTRVAELMDWLVGRELFSSKTFVRWWRQAEPLLRADSRLLWRGDKVELRSTALPGLGGQTAGADGAIGSDEGRQGVLDALDPADFVQNAVDEDDEDDEHEITENLVAAARGILHATPLHALPLDAVPLSTLGLGLCDAIEHALGEGGAPVLDVFTAVALPNGTVTLETTDATPAPPRELIVAACGVLLHWLIGRDLPPTLALSAVLPFLRHRTPGLAASALGPLSWALQPHTLANAPTLAQWRGLWLASVDAERTRSLPDIHRFLGVPSMAFDSHIGRTKLQLTQTNQDAIVAMRRDEDVLALVADGISTADIGSGDLASRLCARAIVHTWTQQRADREPTQWASLALRIANRVVCAEVERLANGPLVGVLSMGTTAVMATCRQGAVHISWVGDSRAYVLGRYGAAMLTADDNVSGERFVPWCNRDLPTWSPDGHPLVRYVGHFDLDGVPAAVPCHHVALHLLPGERLLLCSDGLTDYLSEDEAGVAAALHDLAWQAPLQDVPARLVAAANRHGGGDNISVVLLEGTARTAAPA